MKSVDTGLGFERLVAVLQGKQSNYETDLFTPLVNRAAELSGKQPEGEARISMQVIADHARACVFTVADGAIPSNEGRGYVVRRILRRAARHGHLLGLDELPGVEQISPVNSSFKMVSKDFQPEPSATASMHSLIPKLLTLRSLHVMSPAPIAFLSRNSTGSMPSSWAMMSICCSKAARAATPPCSCRPKASTTPTATW